MSCEIFEISKNKKSSSPFFYCLLILNQEKETCIAISRIFSLNYSFNKKQNAICTDWKHSIDP